uniref:mitochondrial import receptor subunit TOM40 homolog isoform X2 n=1 Tax=Myxine glutinosa TaxID=7769 RepID=UPI00358F527B
MGNVALSNHSHFSSETRSARHAAWKSWRAFRLFNPGAFQDLHQKSEDVFPVKMDGVRLILNKDISFHLKASHAIVLGVPGQSGYHFGATYFGEGETKNGEALPWFVADIDGAGSLSARAEGQFGKNGRARLVLQTHEEKFETWQGTLEKRGRDHTISLTVGNPNVIEGTGVAVLHFLQTISPCLSLGGEMVYHRQGNSEGAFVTAAARYSGQDCVAAMNIGHDMACASTSVSLKTRAQDNVYLIGSTSGDAIKGAKLPTVHQSLVLFFHHLKKENRTARESATLTIEEVVKFWEKAHLPTTTKQHCIHRLERLYEEWRSLQKGAKRGGASQEKKEASFKASLEKTFDLRHADSEAIITNPEDRKFLHDQFSERKASMGSVDTVLEAKTFLCV